MKATEPLPKELVDTEKVYQEHLRAPTNLMLHVELTQNIRLSQFRHHSSDRKEVHQELVKYWLYHFEFLLAQGLTHLQLQDEVESSDAILELINKKDLLRTITANPEQIRTFVSICMIRARLNEKGLKSPTDHGLKELLRQFEPKSSSTVHVSLKETTAFFYGASCWDLLRPYTKTDRDFINYIWQLNLPITHKEQTQHTALPENLF